MTDGYAPSATTTKHALICIPAFFLSGGLLRKGPAPAIEPEEQVVVVDHALPAFGGKLLGIDRGERIGKLMFEDEAGNVQALLNENVHGIVENTDGIFVFTGLNHLSINEGYIYTATMQQGEKLRISRLGRLPGAPRQIQKHVDGSTSFLVVAGFRDDRHYYECYSLTGEIVARSSNCTQPKTTAY